MTDLETRVLDISLYPGLTGVHLRDILTLHDVKGVILRTYGTGNAPEDQEFIQPLADGILKGDKAVVNITQCPQGSVEMGLYKASIGLMDAGVVSGLDMTPEAALTKLMVMLGGKEKKQVKLHMQINQRGEQAQSLFDLEFERGFDIYTYQDRYSAYVTPDRRFEQERLSDAVLRISDLAFETSNADGELQIDVFMNAPHGDEARRVHSIRFDRSRTGKKEDVVEHLPLELVKNIIGESDIDLSLIPSKGIKFTFTKLSLSLFTNA